MLNNSEGTVGESQPFLLCIDFIGKKEYNYVYDEGVIIRSTECGRKVAGEGENNEKKTMAVLICRLYAYLRHGGRSSVLSFRYGGDRAGK